jgi:hypothetical protein
VSFANGFLLVTISATAFDQVASFFEKVVSLFLLGFFFGDRNGLLKVTGDGSCIGIAMKVQGALACILFGHGL